MSQLNSLVHQFLEKAEPSSAEESVTKKKGNIADAPATPTVTELVDHHHLKRARDGGDTSSAAAAPAAKRVRQDDAATHGSSSSSALDSDSSSSGVPAQNVALHVETAAEWVAALAEEKKELQELAGVVGDIQDSGRQITDVALKKRLRACGIMRFENVDDVLTKLEKKHDSVKQLETDKRTSLIAMQELAERYKPALLENEMLVRTAYRGAEEAKAAVMPYIRGALRIGTEGDEETAWFRDDGKNSVCIFASIGRMGTGKTRLQYELCRQEAIKTDFGETHVNFVRLTYSEGFHASSGATTTIFGRNLLKCTGMEHADAQRVQSLEEAIELLYRRLTWPSEKARALVVCVDEFLHLPVDDGLNSDVARANLLRELMRFQQESCETEGANRVVFLFAAVTKEMVEAAASPSGRQLYARGVPKLSNDDAFDLLYELRPDLRARYKNDTQFQQLVHLCLSRPRVLFNGLLKVFKEEVGSIEMPLAVDVVARSGGVRDACPRYLLESDVRMWLAYMKPHGDANHRMWQKRWGVRAEDESLDPLALRYWCEETWEHSQLARSLCEAYVADAKVQLYCEKEVGSLLYNFEAAKRASYDGSFTFAEYYTGGTINGGLAASCVCALPAVQPENFVESVANFAEQENVWRRLLEGSVVVSTAPAETGIEYLVPFFGSVVGTLTHVAAVQVKFSPNKHISGGCKKICDAAMKLPIIKYLQQKKVTCFPVLFSTSHGKMTGKAGEVERGVLYNEAAMFEFTGCLGPLRLHREKASEAQIEEIKAQVDSAQQSTH